MTDELEPWDALHREIGRVAQLHVRLDLTLRRVFVMLAAPGAAMYLVNDSTSTNAVANACGTMLKHADIPEGVRDAGLKALAAAKSAGNDRNRVVHDMWLPDFEGDLSKPNRWSVTDPAKSGMGKGAESVRDLSSVHSARERIFRAVVRAETLSWALWDALPFYRDSGMPASMSMEEQIAIMEDRFDLTANGGYRPWVDG
jgi:hypothetical protein